MDATTQLRRMISLLGIHEHRMIKEIVSSDVNSEKCILKTSHGTYLNLQWLTPTTVQKITEYVCYWIEITKIHNEEENERKRFVEILRNTPSVIDKNAEHLKKPDNKYTNIKNICQRGGMSSLRQNMKWVRKINKLLVPNYCRKIFDEN